MPLGKPLLEALDRIAYGGLVLDEAGQVLQINNTGARLLRENGHRAFHDDDPNWSRHALKALLRSAAVRFRMDEDSWVVIRRDAEQRRPLVLHAVPIATSAPSGAHTVVILLDLDAAPRPRAEALQKIFSLTPAEARLAIEIAGGNSPENVAAASGIKLMTVRKQLLSVFRKTNTRRQPELIAVLARVSILP